MQNLSNHSINPNSQNSNTVFLWQYQPVRKTMIHPELGTYATYGLQLFDCTNHHRHPIANIDDISMNQKFVEELALRFTLHQLSPLHFYDAVYDAVADKNSCT